MLDGAEPGGAGADLGASNSVGSPLWRVQARLWVPNTAYQAVTRVSSRAVGSEAGRCICVRSWRSSQQFSSCCPPLASLCAWHSPGPLSVPSCMRAGGSACSPALPWVFLALCVAAASFLQEPEGLDTDTEHTDLKEATTTTAADGPRDAWGPPPTVLQDKAILGPCGWVAPRFNLVLMCPFTPEPPCAPSPVDFC